MNTFRPAGTRHISTVNVVRTLLLGLCVFGGASAFAGTDGEDGAAIGGYDPVAYFTMLKAVKGSEEHSGEFLGEKWLFVSAEHKSLFGADPMSYMPNYGGYCSYDPVSLGHDHKIDPTAWRIVDGKLYLFYSDATAAHAMPAEKWQKVKAGLAQ